MIPMCGCQINKSEIAVTPGLIPNNFCSLGLNFCQVLDEKYRELLAVALFNTVVGTGPIWSHGGFGCLNFHVIRFRNMTGSQRKDHERPHNILFSKKRKILTISANWLFFLWCKSKMWTSAFHVR